MTMSKKNKNGKTNTSSSFNDAVIELEQLDIGASSKLQREMAKVSALSRQLEHFANENQQLQTLLKQTQHELEKQMKQNLQLQKRQTRQAKTENRNAVNNDKDEELKEVKQELATTQRDLVKEMERSTQQEARLQRVVEQCSEYSEELKGFREKQSKQKEVRSQYALIKNLEHQRANLLDVVKKQMKLIEVLKQQTVHAEAATLLGITEKDFMKELNH